MLAGTTEETRDPTLGAQNERKEERDAAVSVLHESFYSAKIIKWIGCHMPHFMSRKLSYLLS